ncbi:MAG: cupin domain-containing protein [Erysipelotrichaceae bacterium]|nr:cupin domain-containing protein [Erysipelotrichaceae bacterium]
METRAEELKNLYNLTQHPEDGSFAEVYTSSFVTADRAYMGSIYFLLDKDEISHFHQIDCDEIWYYHEGCGMKISVLKDGKRKNTYWVKMPKPVSA